MPRSPRFALALLLGAGALAAGAGAPHADTVRPRFVIIVDSSGSMTENPDRVKTHGDGSETHPGCDIDANGKFDDSKLFQAKLALADTITAFGSAEFSLARYHQNELGQVCSTNLDCTDLGNGATACVGGRCGFIVKGINTTDYAECTGGTALGNGCIRCADPVNDRKDVYYNGNTCCTATDPRSGGFGMSGDVLVAFTDGTSNVPQLLRWIDGKEDFPFGDNRELRATGTTPIGGSLNAVRDSAPKDGGPGGPGAGAMSRGAQGGCRWFADIPGTHSVLTQI